MQVLHISTQIFILISGFLLGTSNGIFQFDFSLFNLPRFNLESIFGPSFGSNEESRSRPNFQGLTRRSPMFRSNEYESKELTSTEKVSNKIFGSKPQNLNSIEMEAEISTLENELSVGMKHNKFYPHTTEAPWNSTFARPGNETRLSFPDLGVLKQLFQWSGQSARSFALCHACKVGIGLFMLRARNGAKAENLMKLVIFGCKFFRIAPEEMCQGLVTRFGPVLLYIVQERKQISGDIFCGMILQSIGCSAKDPEIHWDVVNYQYHEEEERARSLKKRSSEDQIPVNGPTMKILHITDIHVDPEYKPGANAVCDNEMCCREFDKKMNTPGVAAGYYGDYRKCDLPYHSFENALAHIAETHPDIQLIYMTGDLVPHNVWSTEPEENVDIIANCSDLFHRYFPRATIFPVVGNHETHPVNLFSPPGVPPKFSTDWVYASAAKSWARWIPAESMETFLYAGFYDRVINPHFRVIVLNTNLCYTYNFWQMYEDKDPSGQLRWLASELQKSEDADQKVHILGHVPPGQEDCWNVWSKNFYQIITRYSATVTAQFYGHTHYDEFKLFYHPIEKGRPISSLYIGASLTPYTNLNPGYKIFTVDGARGDESSYHVLDHETWIYNLTEANMNPELPPRWYRLYKATEAYRLPNVLPQSLNTLVHRMSSNISDFNLYNRYYYKATDVPECDSVCRKRILCNIVTPYQKQQTECMHLQTEVDGIILPMRIFETKRPLSEAKASEEQISADSRQFSMGTSQPSEKMPSIFDRFFGSRSYLFG